MKLFFVNLAPLFALLLSGSVLAEEEGPTAEPIRVGVVFPLSGAGAFWGQNSMQSLRLLEESAKGQIEFIVEDDACDPQRAVSAYRKLVARDQVRVIIGAICSSCTLAIAPLAQKESILLITPCSEADAISEVGDFVFRLWTPNGEQARVTARYLFSKRKLKRVAVLSILNDYGVTLSEAFASEYEELGGNDARC